MAQFGVFKGSPGELMRILYIVNVMGRGGAEIQLRDRARALVARGHDVTVVSMMPFLDFEDWLRDAGVRVCSLGVGGPATLPRALLRYVRIVRDFHPDVIHSHLFNATMFARGARMLPPALRGSFKALVCTSHSQREVKSIRYIAYRLTNHLGDVWTSVTREGIAVHEAHRAIPAGSAKWTPNGVDMTTYRPDAGVRADVRAELDITGDEFVWLALGSFRDDVKDYGTMLGALARVPGVSRLIIGGGGRLLKETAALADGLGVAGRVTFLGLRTDAERLLQAADAFVLSSKQEAMPNVLLQAAATQLPIVTTDVGEAREIVEHGVGGLVVCARDPVALAQAMAATEAYSPTERRRVGENAQRRVAQQFSMDQIVDRWEQLYRELLRQRP
jgi:glycosyltransferase involved in cell wall biosynthesis